MSLTLWCFFSLCYGQYFFAWLKIKPPLIYRNPCFCYANVVSGQWVLGCCFFQLKFRIAVPKFDSHWCFNYALLQTVWSWYILTYSLCITVHGFFVRYVTSQKDNCSTCNSSWEALVQFLGCFEPRWLLRSIRRLCWYCPREQSVSNCKLIFKVKAPSMVISNIFLHFHAIWYYSWRA